MTNEIETGGPAFPIPSDGKTHGTEPGMMLRDYLAAKAMQGLISGLTASGREWEWNSVAESAYGVADAMLAARK